MPFQRRIEVFILQRDKLVAPLVYRMYEQLASKVIYHFKRYSHDSRLSGDDSSLGNFWEEYKEQIQEQESVFFEVYEDELRRLCKYVLGKIPDYERKLLWLYSGAFIEWDGDTHPDPPYQDSDIVHELMDRIRTIAADEEVRRRTRGGRWQRNFDF